MSEHKTGLSNWTAEEKTLYWERRHHTEEVGKGKHKTIVAKPLRGQMGAVTVHNVVKDEKGKEARIPLGAKIGTGISRGKQSDRRNYRRSEQRAFVKQQRRATGRGE